MSTEAASSKLNADAPEFIPTRSIQSINQLSQIQPLTPFIPSPFGHFVPGFAPYIPINHTNIQNTTITQQLSTPNMPIRINGNNNIIPLTTAPYLLPGYNSPPSTLTSNIPIVSPNSNNTMPLFPRTTLTLSSFTNHNNITNKIKTNTSLATKGKMVRTETYIKDMQVIEDVNKLQSLNPSLAAIDETAAEFVKPIKLMIEQYGKKPCIISVLPSTTMSGLKILISQHLNIPLEDDWSFKLGSIQYNTMDHVSESLTLQDYAIYDGQTIYILNNINIVIHYPGKKPYLLSISSSCTVSQLKMKVAVYFEMGDYEFKICFSKDRNSKSLEKLKCTLDQYGIQDGQKLYLVIGDSFRDRVLQRCFYDCLCDGDISRIHSSNARINTDQFYKSMMDQWKQTNGGHHQIAAIYKIHKNFDRNMEIYNALMTTKKLNKNKALKERILFHGTSLNNLKGIIMTGFNRDCNIRSVYGKGTYFSNIAVIAAHYCKKFGPDNHELKCMLVCKVYTGDSTIGRYHMKESDLYKPDKITQYDSLVNDIKNPTIFVINRDYHAVPCFVIVFAKSTKNLNS